MVKRRLIFILLTALLLIPWPVAYAYGNDMAGLEAVQIEVAEASARPSWNVFGRAIGGVKPGDLFYIGATEEAADITVNLYLTNTPELSHYYRYLILKVGIYAETNAGEWEKASKGNGELIPDTFITLRDAQVGFTLPGYTKHKITIDSGSFYCTTISTDSGSLSPQFYLTVD